MAIGIHAEDSEFLDGGDLAQPDEALRFLADASRVLAASLDLGRTLETLARLAVGRLADWCAVDTLDSDGVIRHLVVHHPDPAKVELARRLQRRYPYDPHSAHGLARVLRTGEPELYEEVPESLLRAVARDEEHLRLLRELGLRSAMIVPLVARGRTLGAITLILSESQRRYGPDDLALAMELGRRAAVSIDNARLYEEAQREIAERRRAEQAIRMSEARYRALFEISLDAIAILDDEGRFADASESMCALLGSPRERVIGSHFEAFAPPGLAEAARTTFRRLKEEGTFQGEFPLIAADGTLVELDWRSRARFLPGLHLCVARDITGRGRAERALRESEGRLRAVVETAVDAIITIDVAGIISSLNPAAERLFGYRADELIGRNVSMLMPEPDHSRHDEYLRRYLRTGERRIIGIGREVVGLRKNGTLFPMDLAVSETVVGDRRIFTGIIRDITDRKRAEESLAQQARELERRAAELVRSNRELESFASIVSHDLRSPLVTISGCVELLEQVHGHALPAEAAELLGFIRDGVNNMTGLIQSLLRYARVGAGGLNVSPCDCETVLEKVLNGLKTCIESAGATVTHDPLPTIHADEALVAQLLQNLVENSVKYRGDRPPLVHVSARESEGEWVFSVRDNGIGIDPRHFPKIFGVFQRLHADESRYPGSGIGLATCKKIVERHGGRIWVESQPGEGTTFFFTIPR